jgi:signal transduction histidine kinase
LSQLRESPGTAQEAAATSHTTADVHRARGARLGSRSLVLAVGQLAAAGVAVGAAELALMFSGVPVDPPWAVVLFPVVAWVYLAAGVVAWLRRPSNRMGALLTAAAYVWLAAGLVNTPVPALIAVGLITATVPLAIIVHLLHGFPSGRLQGRVSGVTVLVGYVVCVVLQAPVYLWGQGPAGPTTVLQIDDRPDLDRIGFWVQTGVGLAVMVVTAIVLAAHLRAMTRAQRRVVAPLFVYGIFAVIFVPLTGAVAKFAEAWGVGLVAVQLGLLGAIPVAFIAAVLLGGFARTGEIEELGTWLGSGGGARPDVAGALADALGDPSLELLFWVPDRSGYVAADGRLTPLPAPDGARGVVDVALGARRIGAIVYDATFIADPELVRTAGRVAAVALDRERLTAELRASREGLRRSRARIAAAADSERRRIARDLHDGLQAELVVLALRAHAVCSDPDAPASMRAEAAELHAGLQTAMDDLRELVHGVMPAALTDRGLGAAVEDLADRIPIPTALDLETLGPLPGAVESAGYFVVSEALANAVKHAGAREVSVRMTRETGRLHLEVHDDGVGGAGLSSGAGLRGMADRVDALEGSLSIESPPGGGTHVIIEVPCAS